ncbi:hypothetical protein OQA88_13306 [Cercophora sp. LCS_1]
MDSHGSTRSLTLADLPHDILRDILDYFVDDPDYRMGPRFDDLPHYDDDDFKTLQSLRSVCRSFCNIASPLLIPTLRVRIDSKSLNRIGQIAKNPLIVAGVRTLQVCTAYRPRELAEDARAYRDLQSKVLRSLERACDWHTEFMHEMSEDELEGDEGEIVKAMHTYWSMHSSWRAWPESDDGKYTALLSESFDEYRRLQHEQEQLLTDGSFVATLAAFTSRLPSLRAVSFLDRADVGLDDFSGRDNLTVLANDHAKFRQLLVAPHTWAALEESSTIPDIPTVKLLWQLPIAMHANGIPLPAIAISRIPILSNFHHLCPSNNDWTALGAACSTLESIYLSSGNHGVLRQEHMPPESQSHLNNYVSALLSGPHLQTLEVDLYGLQLNTGSNHDDKTPTMLNPLGAAISSLRARDLRDIVLGEIAFTQSELEHLFSAVGRKLGSIRFYCVGVTQPGTWAHALHILREKIMASSRECTAQLSRLCGGEFERFKEGKPRVRADSWGLSAMSSSSGTCEREKELWEAVERYVRGEGEGNPLVEIEGGRIGC